MRKKWLGAVLLGLWGSWGCQPDAPTDFHFGIALEGSPTTEEIEHFSQATGLKPHVVVLFTAWPEDRKTFVSPADTLRQIAQTGALPVVTWEPFYFPAGAIEPQGIAAEEILQGLWDDYIDRFLLETAAAETEVWMRFAHEMNTEHYHWGFARNEEFGPEAPFLYRRLFRYVVERSRKLGLSHLRWVFCPNAESVPHPGQGAEWNRASRYYPGDEWVDILGMDGYNWGLSVQTDTWHTRWQSFAEIFQPLQQELRQVAPEKPLWVFETATATTGGDKAAWIAEAAATARAWGLAGVVWFEVNKENDWRLLQGIRPSDLAPLRPRTNP